MFYFVFIFIIAAIFLLKKGPKSPSDKFLILTISAYSVALFATMIYLSKDTYYFNTVYNYFSLPYSIWKIMMFANINRSLILTIMNFFCLAVLYLGIRFSFTFHPQKKQSYTLISHCILSFLIIEFIFYTPFITRALYLWLTPSILSPLSFSHIANTIHFFSSIINFIIVCISIFSLFITCKATPPLSIIQVHMYSISIFYTLIMISYLLIFGTYPKILVKFSKIAGTTTYLSMPLNKNTFILNLFPYYLIFTVLLIIVFLYRTSMINRKISQQTFTLSKQIDASDTTSKVFCHYMKNELLAIQSELEELEPNAQNESITNVLLRCENLYNRLDSIHKSTKASELYLTEVNLNTFIEKFISELSYDLKDYCVTIYSDTSEIYALLDTNYFSQALHNIITNAIDAMSTLPQKRKTLTFTLQSVHNKIVLMIEDTGIGISEENLNKIFTPFYSSEPVSKHWGIGLTLTHKIITAHEGLLEIESYIDQGTTVKIILPKLINITTIGKE